MCIYIYSDGGREPAEEWVLSRLTKLLATSSSGISTGLGVESLQGFDFDMQGDPGIYSKIWSSLVSYDIASYSIV